MMGRLMTGVREFLAPSSVQNVSVPPFEAGLRPNSLLDECRAVDVSSTPDDLVVINGRIVMACGSSIRTVTAGNESTLCEFSGLVTALATDGAEVIAAVEGHGLVAVDEAGAHRVVCAADDVQVGVTAIAASQGRILACIGARGMVASMWPEALLDHVQMGQVVEVASSTSVSVLCDGLGWPSGVCIVGDDVMVSVSHEHRVGLLGGGAVETVVAALPAHPGRIVASGTGWWIAFPYPRNRAAEMFMSEPNFVREMKALVPRENWLVPALRSDNVYRDPLQIGQQRVMGVVKPWAPARSYGLVAHVTRGGRVSHSLHSRPDGSRHGITGVALDGDRLVLACAGSRGLLEVDHD